MNLLSKLFKRETKPEPHPLILKKVVDLYVGDLLSTGYRVLNTVSDGYGNISSRKYKVKMIFDRGGTSSFEQEMGAEVGVWVVAEPDRYTL